MNTIYLKHDKNEMMLFSGFRLGHQGFFSHPNCQFAPKQWKMSKSFVSLGF